ncbi:hypothetical protein GRI68_04905 [Altererythrobacter halimionae]|uniref:VWFA domain-containing protein n=2 Tax=Alteriqipengyuania halimionae TaxID=1926630 RepID=A0A6I4U4Z5_9SPHN|nr:hypothetical protein [Alteriqipengyuania halimionae]
MIFQFVRRLWGNQSGNVYVIGAAAIFPMLAMVGGAVDLSRASMAKSQLQSACDAGVLAGRRALARTGSWGSGEKGKAQKMFGVNYESADFSASDTVFTPTRNADDDVLGTATTKVPTLIMHMFNYKNFELSVSCMAELQISNTDIMFVLDTTGSMGTSNKIGALRQAVKDFHETLAKATSDPGTRVRYGFVPYSVSVNASHLIANAKMPSSYFADSAVYQSREAEFTEPVYVATGPGETTYGAEETYRRVLYDYDCDNWASNGGASSTSGNPPVTTTYELVNFDRRGRYRGRDYGYCTRRPVYTEYEYETRYAFKQWVYRPVTMNASGLSGLGPVSYARDVIEYSPGSEVYSWVDTAGTYDVRELAAMNDGVRGDNIPIASNAWDGCVIERETVAEPDWNPIPDGAQDLDVVSAPDPGKPGSYWVPRWNNISFYRNYDNQTSTSDFTQPGGNYSACPAPMRLFESIPMTSSSVPTWMSNYLNSLSPDGQTYHDIGMIWGVRLGSPRGIFSSDVNDLPNVSTTRHLIFMTDGDMAVNQQTHSAYGIEQLEHRVGYSGIGTNDLSTRHYKRFEAACRLAKNEGYTVWVIAFGTSLTQRMKDCSSGGRWYYASNAAELSAQYAAIASQIADLRIGS